MASEVNTADHSPHHPGITTRCPTTCLGVYTVGDLVTLLTTAARTASPDATHAGEPQQRARHTGSCPLSCLHLSVRVINALKYADLPPRTIGALLHMIRTDQLTEVRNIGRRSLAEVNQALTATGFDVRHTNLI
ncbi:DNA-directed RNA polymerase subunit alpha C-terminal domain-containing protein [Actinomadura sp. NPDC000929]|uniref:DNA-directed RNA polymerase subunit alpha C-terminal domain-containing protein n=1 Tax=Actinomadura sp. NPDC000929 TaxID=3154517 RepID=UPI003390B013